MSKIYYTSLIKYKSKKLPEVCTLVDTGSSNCYIDLDIARFFNISWTKLPAHMRGLGGGYRKIYGPIYPIYTLKFKRNYSGRCKTYITILPEEFGAIISGNWVTENKFPVSKVKEHIETYEF